MNNELKPRESISARSITIEDSYWNFAKQLGRGNASRGIREALYQASIKYKELTPKANDVPATA